MQHRLSKFVLAIGATTALGVVVAASAPLSATAAASAATAHPKATAPVITGVTFSTGQAEGSSTPLVTIKGRGFGNLPQPLPTGNPQAYAGSGCPKPIKKGYSGLDFGNNLWIRDFTGHHFIWQAGFGYPKPLGGNCIGLVIWRYASTVIQFGFGVVYGPPYVLQSGQRYTVKVGTARASGSVSF